MKKLIAVLFLLFISSHLKAQPDKPLVRKGNSMYDKQKFADAETQYRKGLEKNRDSYEGAFNLGDALYKQQKYDEATGYFQNLTQKSKTKEEESNAWYNLGNSYLKGEKYKESVEAYKNALKKNPADEDARYNLSYALNKMRMQEQEQKQNKDNKDQKKEEKKEQQKQEQQKQEQQEQQKQQQPKEQKISKEDAERILQALKNDEKDLQKKLSKKEAVRGKAEKQW